MGGSSSSSSSTASTTANTDKRMVIDGNSLGVSSDSSTVNVTALDGGAIDKAGAAVQAALDTVQANDAIQGQNLSGIIGLAGQLFKGGFESLKTSQGQAQTALQTALQSAVQPSATIPNNLLIAGGVAMVALVAIGRKK